jgi:DNA polymerase
MPTERQPLNELFDLRKPRVYFDIETYSRRDLKACGAHVYATDPSTGVFFMCFAVDDGEVQVWRPGREPPLPFANSPEFTFVSDNWTFERLILEHVLIPRHGFTPITLEDMDCAQRRALASAFPAELGLRCEALGLPYKKDPAARRAMRRLSSLHEYKDLAARERDLALLHQRCVTDVEATRACYNHPRLRPLSPEERRLLLLDAEINRRGITANVPFLEAARALAIEERDTIDARLCELTAGAVTSVFQRDRILEAINACGHGLTSLGKRSVAAALAHQPEGRARELLLLRQRGALTSTQKNLLNFTDPGDHRIRDALRFCGAGPGRWTSPGAQLHNLSRNDADLPASLVGALVAGDRAEMARYGDPLKVLGGLSRAALCAARGHVLICADFGAIESRITAWLAGEVWKLDVFRRFDATGDKALDHYRILAHLILKKNTPVSDVTAAERQLGKFAELAFGFGGSVGAWRKIVGDDGRSDAEIQAIVQAWRSKHPATRAFWRRLMRAALTAIHTKRTVEVNPPPLPPITAAFDGYALTLTLPSGRAINYPGARLAANKKFEDGDLDIEYMDNARGQWKPVRAWFGTLVENVVQGTARDLLAAAIIRAEARWPGSVVFHCHDELVIEAPVGAIPERDVLALTLEPPAWVAGLPLGGKVRSGPLYLEAPIDHEAEIAVPPAHELPRAAASADHLSSPQAQSPQAVQLQSPQMQSQSPPPASSESERTDLSDSGGDLGDSARDHDDVGNPARHLADHDKNVGDPTRHFADHDDIGDPARHFADHDDVGDPARHFAQSQSPPPTPPASDRGPSSVGNGRDGFGALGGDLDDLARGGNGRTRDGYPHGEHERGRKVAEYIYRDLKGKSYLKVAKYVLSNGKKSFPQYHLENGLWVKGKSEGPAIPYRLPELLAAPPNATVEICEGEKDADNLAALGLIATTSPGGAGKWTPDLNKWFTGFARASIYEDNDEAGHKHVAKVASELCGVIPDVRAITFRELPDHSDVSDWLETGKTRDDLLARAEQAPKFAALESVCAADEDIAALDWVWPGHFALKKIGLITGLPNEGKGVLLSDIVARVTTGGAWPCDGGSAPLGNVILLTAEDDINDTIVPRLIAASADRQRVHIVKMMREADKERMFNLVTDLPVLRQKIVEVGDVKAIIIDPVADLSRHWQGRQLPRHRRACGARPAQAVCRGDDDTDPRHHALQQEDRRHQRDAARERQLGLYRRRAPRLRRHRRRGERS